MKNIDRLFAGDGVTPSTATLVTGMPGSGKSTMMIQLADSLTKQGHLALYNTGEEHLFQVRRVVERLQLRSGFIVGQNRLVTDILDHANSLLEEAKGKTTPAGKPVKVFLIQDSLQCLDYPREETVVAGKKKKKKGRPLSGEKASLRALEDIIDWAKTSYSMCFVIGHVNKGGDFAGKNVIKHMIDCHLHLGWEIDRSNGNEVPIVEMTKNRFGPSGLYFGFDLTETGLVFKKVE